MDNEIGSLLSQAVTAISAAIIAVIMLVKKIRGK